jgi:hypothetical protein
MAIKLDERSVINLAAFSLSSVFVIELLLKVLVDRCWQFASLEGVTPVRRRNRVGPRVVRTRRQCDALLPCSI